MPGTGAFCKKCGYDLLGGREPVSACPECGRAFDLARSSTFDRHARQRLLRRFCRRVAWFVFGVAFLLFVYALLPAGYWRGTVTLRLSNGTFHRVERVSVRTPWLASCWGMTYPSWTKQTRPDGIPSDYPDIVFRTAYAEFSAFSRGAPEEFACYMIATARDPVCSLSINNNMITRDALQGAEEAIVRLVDSVRNDGSLPGYSITSNGQFHIGDFVSKSSGSSPPSSTK